MTIQPPRRWVTGGRKEIIRYVSVLILLVITSVAVGALTQPPIGIAVFVAAGKFILPKRAPFWGKGRN